MENNSIKIIVGLGNPGRQYHYTRHNIGFRVVDALAQAYNGSWKLKDNKEVADIIINNQPVLLVKPQTFMNKSGDIIPSLLKHGCFVNNLLVVHDELEKPFGSVTYKIGGSHKGHNGLRSIIQVCGENFARVRCGISRPTDKNAVAEYVLSPFSEDQKLVEKEINDAIDIIKTLFL